jgi:hypothetical protein
MDIAAGMTRGPPAYRREGRPLIGRRRNLKESQQFHEQSSVEGRTT